MMPPRKRFYIPEGMKLGQGDYSDTDRIEIPETDEVTNADLVSSQGWDGFHYPVLDIDFQASLVPSETPGHFHLFLDRGIDWLSYTDLLIAFERAGLIEPGYVSASLDRGATYVALRPWKGER